jgi:multimeric flavodoxin WrbA
LNIAVILGTSRINGNTHQLAEAFIRLYPSNIYNLSDFTLSSFDYEHKNVDDDFIRLIRKLNLCDHWVFATPVYWYSMSSQMKIFFDRLSDLITIEKEQGRKLKGKSCSLLVTGSEDLLPSSFEQPLILTANYFGMDYKGVSYTQCLPGIDETNLISHLKSCVSQIFS